jgi:hypothetical protein
MTKRNPTAPQRRTEANARKTEERIKTYYGLKDLLAAWEAQPDDVQIREHNYIIKLRAKVRMNQNLILHRASPEANIL